jgi:glutamate synthase domain-containing protein 2/glutamate synthase domain-containing protein 1/glutamate synthase domain-containing protein 3
MRAAGLYDSANEHDACGVGFVANVNGAADRAVTAHALSVLRNLQHRGAIGADRKTGDGAGILTGIPDAFMRRALRDTCTLPAAGRYGVGMVFLPPDAPEAGRACLRRAAEAAGLPVLGWRAVPVDPGVLGEQARQQMPYIAHCVLDGGVFENPDDLERKLFVVRKDAERLARAEGLAAEAFYIPSLSARTLVYKGLMTGTALAEFYPDLADAAYVTAVAIVHERYSTNTFPSWRLAQPFRYLAHNGEINTLRGNRNAMRSREKRMVSPVLGEDLAKVLPVLEEGGSDSACLDNAFELLTAAGRSLPHAMLMLIPQAWGPKYAMGPDLRGFFEYHAGLMEPWDGPAAVAFTDGRVVGALLDRNGLRPARYTLSADGLMVFASEVGVVDLPPESVVERGALRPGQMILVDMQAGRMVGDAELKMQLARRQPYRRWVEENRIEIHGLFDAMAPVETERATLVTRERLFGYTREDRRVVLGPMAEKGYEPIGSMGADVPLAVLSEQPQLLYNYFKQLFAQITNPAIDPIREELVMSLMTFLGTPDRILEETPRGARLVKLRHPFLSNEDLVRIRSLNRGDFACRTLPIGFPAHGGGAELEEALESLCRKAEAAVANGEYRFLVLSDRDMPPYQAPIPALLAVSAVNCHLVRKGLRTPVSLIVETGEAREVMHMAVLLGHGASAINPYLAFEIVADLAQDGELEGDIGVVKANENYVKALCKGLLKVMSKMGISTLRSYRGAQVFEAVGLNQEVMNRYFTGTASRIGGIGLDGIAREVNARHASAYAPPTDAAPLLPPGGRYGFRRDGERHLWTPETVSLLQRAAREDRHDLYAEFAERINRQERRQSTLRGLLDFTPGAPVPLEEVEPVEAIRRRFVTGAMSFGSISREAHETLAIAMNRIGGMSNSGEGGEDPERYRPLPNGDSRCSAIKQVASGRFGVTAEYLVNARELQIKIAQGAKPGEGGQLPGHKVNAEIARVRHATPGVTLISPPPHHDIYSIEDIKQLIYDLKNANPEARVSVKLVSEVGVGTVAAGVAKGRADMILISGYDGGTGASPLSSIQHAGLPWELGLAETQQTLVENGLRSRVRLQTDGQIKTGRDVVIAALLGAEEFGFATTALVVCGCVMMRKCHNNTCPVGVATQDPRLRRMFAGKPEHVVRFMTFVAEEVRGLMAVLGFRTMDEMIGRADRLEVNDAVRFWKARGLDLRAVLSVPAAAPEARRATQRQEHELDKTLDAVLLPQVAGAIASGTPVRIEMPVRNVHRTVGTQIAGRVARRYGSAGLPDDTITLAFRGAAGQSFGAFGMQGMTFLLEGEANDYLGKGLCGAKIVVKPYAGSRYAAQENIIAGNVLLYGATSGSVFLNGRVGERFAIRNSGATAVVEGVGDHACEYMTGGTVVVLGPTGINFGAGMSGGIAYVLDETGMFDSRCNLGMVDLELMDAEDRGRVRGLLEAHHALTGSTRAAELLDDWENVAGRFVKVFPMEYRRALGRMSRDDEATEREERVFE